MASAEIRDFWIKRRPPWPKDRNGYTFLLEAVHVVGRALCGKNWTGFEPVAPHKPLGLAKEVNGEWVGVPLENASAAHVILAHGRLRQVDPTVPNLPEVVNGKIAWPGSPEQWERAISQSIKEDVRNTASFHRFCCVMDLLTTALAEGALTAVVREIEGGQFKPLPAHVWNTENYSARFAYGQIDLDNPYGDGVCDSLFPSGQIHQRKHYRKTCDFRFIMVDQDGLAKLAHLIETRDASPAPNTIAPELAPDPETAVASTPPRSILHPQARVDDWLIQTYQGQQQPSQEKAFADAKAAFPGITRDQVRPAMDRVALGLGWSKKRGPRGERKQHA